MSENKDEVEEKKNPTAIETYIKFDETIVDGEKEIQDLIDEYNSVLDKVDDFTCRGFLVREDYLWRNVMAKNITAETFDSIVKINFKIQKIKKKIEVAQVLQRKIVTDHILPKPKVRRWNQ